MRRGLVVGLIGGAALLFALARGTRRGVEKEDAAPPVPVESALEAAPAPLQALVPSSVPEAEAKRAPVVNSPAQAEEAPEVRVLHGTLVWIDRAGVEHEEESGSFGLVCEFRGHPVDLPVRVEAGRWRAELPLVLGRTLERFVGNTFRLGGRPAIRRSVEGVPAEDGSLELRVQEPAHVRLEVRSSLDDRPIEEVLVREVSKELFVTDSAGEGLSHGMGRLWPPLELETRSGGFLRIGARMHTEQRVEVSPDSAEIQVVLHPAGILRVQLDRGLAGARCCPRPTSPGSPRRATTPA